MQNKIQADVAAAGAAEAFARFVESRPDAERSVDEALAADKRREVDFERANKEMIGLADRRASLVSRVQATERGAGDYYEYPGYGSYGEETDVLKCVNCDDSDSNSDGDSTDNVSYFCPACRHAEAKRELEEFDRQHPSVLAFQRERVNRRESIAERKRFADTAHDVELLVRQRGSELDAAWREVL
eukprot:jgi/Tetstr1/454276/TSEL_041195.t1